MFKALKDDLICTGGKLAIMGGTFDPIHLGHLVIAEAARVQYGFDHVIFVPSGQPPHKDSDITAPAHRYVMTILATMNNPFFTVSSFEVERKCPSYTIDTVAFLRRIRGQGGTVFHHRGRCDAGNIDVESSAGIACHLSVHRRRKNGLLL